MKDRNLAIPILKRLFETSRIEGIKFDYFPQLLFTENVKQQIPIFGQIYLNLLSTWAIFDAVPSSLPNSADDLPKFSKETQTHLLLSLKNIQIVRVELGSKHPHLILTFENGKVFVVNGIDGYECWQAGVASNPKETCQIIACPGGELAIWNAKTFSY